MIGVDRLMPIAAIERIEVVATIAFKQIAARTGIENFVLAGFR